MNRAKRKKIAKKLFKLIKGNKRDYDFEKDMNNISALNRPIGKRENELRRKKIKVVKLKISNNNKFNKG